MYPSKHIALGLIFSILLFFIYPWIGVISVSLIFLSSFLIDVDHYLYYVHKKKDWNFKRAYDWNIQMCKKFEDLPKEKRKDIYTIFCFLHGVEILAILFLLGTLISNYSFFIFLGVLFHLLLDIFQDAVFPIGRIDKVSIIYDFLKFNKLKFIGE